jgi:hypothetical protein
MKLLNKRPDYGITITRILPYSRAKKEQWQMILKE